MKSASVHELKKELSVLDTPKLLEHIMALVKYKKDNKELLTYLLFHAHDEQDFISSVKIEMDELFETVNTSSVYLAKKTLRKILRTVTKYIRYAESKTVEIEVLLYYCVQFKQLNLDIDSSMVLTNLYHQQIKKIQKSMLSLHEDLQYDYQMELDPLL
jgi:hypothetical protein